MKNITKLTEDLRSSFHISDETIHSILEAQISHSKVRCCFSSGRSPHSCRCPDLLYLPPPPCSIAWEGMAAQMT